MQMAKPLSDLPDQSLLLTRSRRFKGTPGLRISGLKHGCGREKNFTQIISPLSFSYTKMLFQIAVCIYAHRHITTTSHQTWAHFKAGKYCMLES